MSNGTLANGKKAESERYSAGRSVGQRLGAGRLAAPDAGEISVITIDPIGRLINELSAAGYSVCRADELPEAVDGFNDGKFQTEGQDEMTSDSEWEEVLGQLADDANDQQEMAKVLATKVCGENHTQTQFGLAYEVVRLRAQLRAAEAELRQSFLEQFTHWAVTVKGLDRREVLDLTISAFESDIERYHRLVNEFHSA